jgi:hypothetical protein
MSFFEKAKQAATEMAAKADQAMANAGISGPGLGTGAAGPGGPGGQAGGGREAEAALRDYGLLVWREQHGHPIDATEKEHVVGVLRRLECSGALEVLRVGGVVPGAAAPPPPPPPPPPGAAAAGAAHDGPSGGHVPPPPPPSWA